LRRIFRPEVALDEDDVGDRPRHLRARALADRETRRLQRRHVVHTVTDHGHVAPLTAERLHHPPLVVGGDPADDGSLQRDVYELLVVLRQPAPVERCH
jgi:hypothetical protein